MKNNGGYMLAFVIVSLTVLIIAIYGVSQILIVNNAFFGNSNYGAQHDAKFDIGSELFFTKAKTLNSDGVVGDSVKCLTGVLRVSGSSANCYDSTKVDPAPKTFSQTSGADGIEDDFDNNDYKCTFANDSDYSKIDKPNSKKCDNDDEHRVYISGIIPPGETVTALSLTPDLFEIISLNRNNIGPNVRRSLPENTSFTIKMDVSGTGIDMDIYEIDKDILDTRDVVFVGDSISGNITSISGTVMDNGNLSGGSNILFDTNTKYYAILLTNTSDQIRNFKLYGETSGGDLVYLNSITDDGSLIEYTKPIFIKKGNDLVYKTKLFYVEK